MSNTTLTADIVAKEAVRILENDCIMGDLVYRGYEEEFSNNVNGYKVGDTVRIRRPTDFTVRTGATAAVQDVVEGSTSVAVDTQIGVDFKFTSSDLTLKIGTLSERVIKPALIQLANQVDGDILGLYKKVPNHVTIPSGGINSFADFALAPERMDKIGIPRANRSVVLTATDTWAMLGSQTALYMQDKAKEAYETARLGMIGGIDTYTSLNCQDAHHGSRSGTDTISTRPSARRHLGVDQGDQPEHHRHQQHVGCDGHAGRWRYLHHRQRVRCQPGHEGASAAPEDVRGVCRTYTASGSAIISIWLPRRSSSRVRSRRCYWSNGITDSTARW
jgi:hypothetical protein